MTTIKTEISINSYLNIEIKNPPKTTESYGCNPAMLTELESVLLQAFTQLIANPKAGCVLRDLEERRKNGENLYLSLRLCNTHSYEESDAVKVG